MKYFIAGAAIVIIAIALQEHDLDKRMPLVILFFLLLCTFFILHKLDDIKQKK